MNDRLGYYSMREAMAITGWTWQWLGRQAAQKQIPGAYQPGGKRGDWRFECEAFDKFWAKRSRPEVKG